MGCRGAGIEHREDPNQRNGSNQSGREAGNNTVQCKVQTVRLLKHLDTDLNEAIVQAFIEQKHRYLRGEMRTHQAESQPHTAGPTVIQLALYPFK
ncbi:unnamed protein product [Danaus chrysippus]|uniref:(African queen) hypothetical protein n=1 Tax=Danaus chrysippus TaxID=151541 RepID=A0A8J2QE87_9NEOP|nr:unnamed protein product [Danaus chrysippus]